MHKYHSWKESLMPDCRPRFFGLFLLLAISMSIFAVAQTASQPGTTVDTVTASQPLRDGVEVQAGSSTVRITALRDDIIRVRISAEDTLPEDASWAVLPEARSKTVDVRPVDDAAFVGFRTAALDVRVERSPLRIVIRDLSGNVISADEPGRPTKFQLGGFYVYKQMPGSEHYFGLGDKTGQFDRRELPTRCGTLTSARK